MEPTQALNFNIPKLKRQVTKDNLFEIDSNSRDAKELLDNVARTYLDQNYSGPWKVTSVHMVRNTELEQEYKAKRTDMKEEGRHSRELIDQIAFCAVKEPSYVTKIAKNGMMTKNLPFSIIGEHKSGVYLTKHADVQLKMVETISSQAVTALFVFNTLLGKCKAINERVMSNAEPTPNYDCHVPLQPAQPSDSQVVQLQRSQIFLYEYDNDGMPARRPRQCLPYAVITYEKTENFTMGPLKSIYFYDPTKSSSQTKKSEEKSDWKKTRNTGNAQLPFSKNPLLDNQIRSPPPFGSLGWSGSLMPGCPNRDILGTMTQTAFNPDVPHDLETGSNQCGILASNYAQKMPGVDGQGVVVHRSGSDPRRRLQQKSGNWDADELTGASGQQRNLPPQQSQTFPNIRPGYQGGFDYQYSNEDQNMDSMSGWESKAPHGFYNECEPTDNSTQLWYQSALYNNNNNNNNKCGPPNRIDSGSNSSESDDKKKTKSGNTNCDNKSTNNTNKSSATSSNAPKKSIPFALNKKKSTTAANAANPQQKTQDGDDQDGKAKDSSSSSSVELEFKTKLSNNTTASQKKDTNSTETDSKQKLQGKVQESVASKIPFPKKSLVPQVAEELPKPQTNPQDSHIEDLFTKLFQVECKDNIDTFGGKSAEKGKNIKSVTKVKGSTAGQLVDKAFSIHDILESDLKKLQDYIKEKMKSSKENEKKASKKTDNTPKIKTTLSSLKQGLKTTILLPISGKNNEENVPSLEDLTKLNSIVGLALNQKNQPETTPPTWENNYQSFIKTVQKMELTPGQQHKWVRKKEPPPEPPAPDKIPPPATEVSIDDVLNTKLMKELLLEQDFSESTSVSEADSLYLPPNERKRRKTSSLTTRRQAKKKAPFDMTSYRRRRKRQKMQRKAAAEFDNNSLASTTSSFGFGESNPNFWESDFKELEMETSLHNDLLSYGKERLNQKTTLKELGYDTWKDAMLSLKFQPVVVLKDCVQQITSHLHQEGSSSMMEWIGSQKELLETLNLPPDHSPVSLSSSSSAKAITQGKANVKVTSATSKNSQKPKVNKINTMDAPSTSETISINSIKASVRSEINKIKKMPKKNVSSGTVKKKTPKSKAPAIEIPRIKPKLPEKSFIPSTKPDMSLQSSVSILKDVKKPTPSLTTSNLTSQTQQSKTLISSANKTIPPKGIMKNARLDSTIPKTSTVSPATFPPTDQSLKVDLLMESISAPPTIATTASEREQKKLVEQKKQKISFQTYMEKHVKSKPKSPPREKTNVFEAFKDIISSEADCGTKPISESLVTPPTTTPLLEKIKPSLVMPPGVGTFTNSLFSPLSPTPQIPRDPRIPSKLPLPFSKEPPLPKIIPIIPKSAKEDLKPLLKDKPSKSTMSHKKAPPPKTIPTSITIPLDDPREQSQAPVDPRLSRKPAPSQPDFHPIKESLPKPSTLNDPSLPRDPRLLKMYGEYQSEGVIGNKIGKTPTQETSADVYSPVKLKSDPTDGVSDIIGKSKPLIKKDTWNLCAIQTVDDRPKPPRRPLSTNEEIFLDKSLSKQKPGTQGEDIPAYAQFSKDVSKSLKPSKVSLDNKKGETRKSESSESNIDRQAWGFYREMSPKRSGSEDANSVSDKDFKPSLIQQKCDDNTCSDMDIASESPQALYFSDSDSNLIGEDLTKPLYIDESVSSTPKRDSFESYKFSLKSPEHGFKKHSEADIIVDPRKSTHGMDPKEKLEGFKNTLVSSECTTTENIGRNIFGLNLNNNSSESTEQKLSPFNETVPPADPESKNSSASSLFCAYQMEGEAELKDTSHIWMKSLSTLSQAKAVSTLKISDEILDVLRKVVKENIPAGQKDLSPSTSLSTPKETSGKISEKDLHKPGTLDKDYKLEDLDKDLFKSSSLNEELLSTGDLHKVFLQSESIDNNACKPDNQSETSGEEKSVDAKYTKTTNSQNQQENSNLNTEESTSDDTKCLTEMYSPTHPTSDETSEKQTTDLVSAPKSKEFVPGQAIPVLNHSGKKPPKKSRSLSPTATIPSSTHYLPSSSGWMASQQQPFWPRLNQKFDGVWRNIPSFNPIITTSHPTQQIWPHPINVAPSHLGNIPFPLGYINPDLPTYRSNATDSSKAANLLDWFADKITPKGETTNNENNAPKTSKDPHVELVANFLNMLSSSSKAGSTSDTDSPSTSLASTKGTSSKLTTGSSSAETKPSRGNIEKEKISKSESFAELTSINTNQENNNNKGDSEKSRSSSYSPTDKTSEIVSISASDPSMSPGPLDSIKTAEKESVYKLKRTVSIDSSLSSESCSRFPKMDSLKKTEGKQLQSDLPIFSAASPSSNDDSEDDNWHKTNEENQSSSSGLNTEQNPSILEPSASTTISDSTPGQQDVDTSFSENNNDSATNEEFRRKRKESGESWKKSKNRTKSRHKRPKKKSDHSSSIPKFVQISTINSKSLKDIELAKSKRELLRELAEQFPKKKRKSDLRKLLESVKKIKKELASQPSEEKGGNGEKSEKQSLQSPSRSRHGSEERNSSSRTRKLEKDEKGWSEKLWKPVKSIEVDSLAASSSNSTSSTTTTIANNNNSCKNSSNNKQNSDKDSEALSSKTFANTNEDKDISKDDDKQMKLNKEEKDCDSELEEGELPDDRSETSEENINEEYPKHRSSRRKSESCRRKRRQPDRRHSSHEERFYKRRMRQSNKEEGVSNKPENYPYERMDTYPCEPPDGYPHDRIESYQHSRMDCYPADKPEDYPTNRVNYKPDGPEDCPSERPGFYPPNRMDNYNNGRSDNFPRGKQKRFHGKRSRFFRGKFAPYSHNKPGGHFRDESNNYPENNDDRYPRGRSDSYPYGKADCYMPDNYGPSHDPDDYIQDESDGLLYEKSDDYIPFKKGYSHNWPDRHQHGRRGGSYSPGREEEYPNDNHFLGRGSPPRGEETLHQGRYPSDNWSTTISHLREIKIEVKNISRDNKGQKVVGKSVSSENLAVEALPETEKKSEKESMVSAGQYSYGDQHKQTGPNQTSANHQEEEDKKMRDTFDTIDNYLQMFVKEGCTEYKILKKALGVPLETRFDSMSKTKRKKIRKKIQSQLQALKQAPSISNSEGMVPEPDNTHFQAPEKPSFKMEDFQNFSSFEGNTNSMDYLKNWLNQRPDEEQLLHSRSSSETRDDSEEDGNPISNVAENPEDWTIADPEIRRAIKTVAWMERSPGFGTPHQRVPLNLLLAEEKDNLFSFEGCFLILMRKIPRKAVERLVTLREVLNILTCDMQAAQKANDMIKFHKLQATKTKLHERRKDLLEKFTGSINPQRLQTIKEAKKIFENCLEYMKKKPEHLPNIDKEFVVKTIKAIQGHINMTKKFLDEQASTNAAPPMSSIGFGHDMIGPNSAPDAAWSWFGHRNMDKPISGCYNPPWNNMPF